MHGDWTLDLAWWATAVELPALAGLFWLMQRGRSEVDGAQDRLRDDLSAFKLEVARSYASTAALKDVELRLTEHLVRIEAKLDRRMGGAHGE